MKTNASWHDAIHLYKHLDFVEYRRTASGVGLKQLLAAPERKVIASAMPGTSTALAGIIAALLTHGGSNAFSFGLTFGIVAGTVSAIVSVFSPFVEWWADHLPARRLGAFGTMILLLGLILQSACQCHFDERIQCAI